jgi:hypothetical protein
MERAKVLDFELQKQLVPYMKDIVPLPGGRGSSSSGTQAAFALPAAFALSSGWQLLPATGWGGGCTAAGLQVVVGCRSICRVN